MALRCMSDRVKLLLTPTVLLMIVISTVSTKQCTSKKTEKDVYVIRNIGIKLCKLKCAEYGQCVSIEYDSETLTCRLSRDDSKTENKEGRAIPARSHSHVPYGSCTSGKCSLGQRCLKTRSGKEVCVQASTDLSPNMVPPVPVITQDIQASMTDARKDLTLSKEVASAPVTTQVCDPHATPSPTTVYDLYNTSRDGDLESVKRILATGQVDINMRGGQYSATPVMAAAQRGHRGVVELLVGRGANVSLVDKVGNNLLLFACIGGQLETVKLILSLNVLDINSRGKYSRTPVMVAARFGHRGVVKFLVGRGADVSLVDTYGLSVLHWVCIGGDLETVKLILSLNMLDINTRGRLYGKTPLMMAVQHRHRYVAAFLVQRGADVSLVDSKGNNVLHYACFSEDLETVKLMLSLNALDINARNYKGQTVADWARVTRHQQILDILVSRGDH